MKEPDVRDLQDQYYKWVFNRIKDRKALCYLYKGHKCVPSHDESCRNCYRKENSLT